MYCTWDRNEGCGKNDFPSPIQHRSQGMEGERVHGPHVVDIVYCLSMAFKCVFLVLDFRGRVNIFHGDPPLNRGCGIACEWSQGV